MWLFSGFIGEVDPTPIYSCCGQNGWHSAVEFLFLQGAWFNTFNINSLWLLRRVLLEKSWGLHYFIEGVTWLFRIWSFQRGIQSCLRNLMVLSTRIGLDDLSWSYPQSLKFSPGSCVHTADIVCQCCYGIILGPLVNFWIGIQIFGGGCFAVVSDVLGSILPTFWYHCYLT